MASSPFDLLNSIEDYKNYYELSIQSPDLFWIQVAKNFYWTEPIPENKRIFKYNIDANQGPIKFEFLKGIQTNITYNLLDRIINHGLGERVAYYWEGNSTGEKKKITYSELKIQVCRMANVLKRMNVGVGDSVAIYLPMIIELPIAMLACARIGAIHTVVFAGYSAASLAERMIDAGAKILITTDASFRGDKFLHFLPIVDEAIKICLEKKLDFHRIILVNRFDSSLNSNKIEYDSVFEDYVSPFKEMILKWNQAMINVSEKCEPEWVDAEHPLFLLYTSGTTGVPKGIIHTVGGYMLSAALAFKHAFNYQDGNIYFCTGDLAWIAGLTGNLYGPLANGATCILYEGVVLYPSPDRLWTIIDKYRVNQLYTSPTNIRSLMRFGEKFVNSFSLNSLKVIGLVGEPINKEAWLWLHKNVGKGKCSIVDTYYQTEMGIPIIFPIPKIVNTKPGSATLPFFGISPVILDDNGKEIKGTEPGILALKQAYPGLARTIYKNHERFESVYFKKYPGYYFSGDGAYKDSDGYYWINGRIDDLLNVAGHLLSTAQVESVLLIDKHVAEVAAVPMPHPIKGQCICVFIVLKELSNGATYDIYFEDELRELVRKEIGPVSFPELIINVKALPKTRSGKVMRRLLAKIASGEKKDFGDLSILEDENIVKHLIEAVEVRQAAHKNETPVHK